MPSRHVRAYPTKPIRSATIEWCRVVGTVADQEAPAMFDSRGGSADAENVTATPRLGARDDEMRTRPGGRHQSRNRSSPLESEGARQQACGRWLRHQRHRRAHSSRRPVRQRALSAPTASWFGAPGAALSCGHAGSPRHSETALSAMAGRLRDPGLLCSRTLVPGLTFTAVDESSGIRRSDQQRARAKGGQHVDGDAFHAVLLVLVGSARAAGGLWPVAVNEKGRGDPPRARPARNPY